MVQLLWARQWGAFGTPSLKGKSQIWLLESRESSCGSKRVLPGRNWGPLVEGAYREGPGKEKQSTSLLPPSDCLLLLPIGQTLLEVKGKGPC